ncbi:MAG: DinB family protein, partial [Bacteroidota bacterium]
AEWQEKWNNSQDYTLELLALVPEDSLQYKPTEEQKSIRAQFQHMAGNMFGLSRRYIADAPEDFDWEATEARLNDETLDKAALIQLLKDAHAFANNAVAGLSPAELGEKVDFFAGPKTRRQVAWLLHDHATHHRGQVTVYARLLGIKPPRYRGW